MKLLFILWGLFAILPLSHAQSLLPYKSHRLQFPTPVSDAAPIHIAPWKGSYLITYTDLDRTGYLLKTQDFKQYEILGNYPKVTIWDIETAGGEIALLTSNWKGERAFSWYEIYFTKIDPNGKWLETQKLIGDADMKKPQAYCLDSWARRHLIWAGDHYRAYFTIEHNRAKTSNEPTDVHQAHTEIYFRKNGEWIDEGFPWMVSHTFTLQVTTSDNYILKACLGDAYPRGLYYNLTSKTIARDPEDPEDLDYYLTRNESGAPMLISGASGDNDVDLVLGDPQLNEQTEKIYLSGTTRDGRTSADVFIVVQDFDKDQAPQTIWITNTPTVEEHSVRLFPYGKDTYLLLWQEYDLKMPLKEDWEEDFMDQYEESQTEGEKRLFAEVQRMQRRKAVLLDKMGKMIGKPEAIDLALPYSRKTITAAKDYFAVALEYAFMQELTDALVEPSRLILPFHLHKDQEVLFYEISRPRE